MPAIAKLKAMIHVVEPSVPSTEAEVFYGEVLRELSKSSVSFLIGGTYALAAHTGIARATKDLDIFCKPGDSARILERFKQLGYTIVVEDERWLAKVFERDAFVDIIYATWDGSMPVGDPWFEHAVPGELFGVPVRLIAPTELIWSKSLVQGRHRYDGADIGHLILRQHDRIDWQQLLAYMELNWEVLLGHLINFRWAYPSERNHVPRWLMDELIDRLRRQLDLPAPRVKICRGRMFSQIDYEIAVKEWGFRDVGNEGAE